MRSARLLASAVLCVTLPACDAAPGDVREWAPADHDQPAPGQGAQVPQKPGAEGADPNLIELAWQRNCATCHGAHGRGDGPQGPMFRPPDLTDAAVQDRVTDAQMVESIRKGRNKMPAFDLPPQVIEGLIARIRASRAR